jgi:hypothetical protein
MQRIESQKNVASSTQSGSHGEEKSVVGLGPRDWLTRAVFYKTAAAYMATRLYVNVTQVYVPLYLQDSLNLEARHLATVPLVMYVSGFAASFAIKYANKRMGRKVSDLAHLFLTLCAARIKIIRHCVK